jgi:hypothetical protein
MRRIENAITVNFALLMAAVASTAFSMNFASTLQRASDELSRSQLATWLMAESVGIYVTLGLAASLLVLLGVQRRLSSRQANA